MTVSRRADSDQPQASELEPSTESVGEGAVVVQSGDCLSSIAEAHGFAWEQLWDHPRNARLRQVRGDPSALWPGDRVFVPEVTPKSVRCAVNRRHRFSVKGVPARLRLRFLEAGQPRSGDRYVLVVDGRPRRGALDGDGVLSEAISPLAREAVLKFDDDPEPVVLSLGGLRPIDTVAGVQARLANLGFDPGTIDDLMGPRTRRALRRFQRSRGLPRTGEPDGETSAKLLEAHGS